MISATLPCCEIGERWNFSLARKSRVKGSASRGRPRKSFLPSASNPAGMVGASVRRRFISVNCPKWRPEARLPWADGALNPASGPGVLVVNSTPHLFPLPVRGGEDSGLLVSVQGCKDDIRPHPGPLPQERENHSPPILHFVEPEHQDIVPRHIGGQGCGSRSDVLFRPQVADAIGCRVKLRFSF